MELNWYEYDQNNSGGSFCSNDEVTYTVYIQAQSNLLADAKAEDIGIYFDGCSKDYDCECCGDRWFRAWGPLEGFQVYTPYDEDDNYNPRMVDYFDIESMAQGVANAESWAAKGEVAVILYYWDGTVKRFKKGE